MKRQSVISILLIGGVISICSCAASVQSVGNRNTRLSSFNRVVLHLINSSGGISFTSAEIGGVTTNESSTTTAIITGTGNSASATGNTNKRGSASITGLTSAHSMSGNEHALQAIEGLQFELANIGFDFVSNENQADAVIEFSIGTIRYDPIAGWIADQATLKFRDIRTGKILVHVRAKPKFITPTVNNIVANLAKEIRKRY